MKLHLEMVDATLSATWVSLSIPRYTTLKTVQVYLSISLVFFVVWLSLYVLRSGFIFVVLLWTLASVDNSQKIINPLFGNLLLFLLNGRKMIYSPKCFISSINRDFNYTSSFYWFCDKGLPQGSYRMEEYSFWILFFVWNYSSILYVLKVGELSHKYVTHIGSYDFKKIRIYCYIWTSWCLKF